MEPLAEVLVRYGELIELPTNGRPLSPREKEIAGLVKEGFKNKEIATKLFIQEQTVKNHLHNIFTKLGISDRYQILHP